MFLGCTNDGIKIKFHTKSVEHNFFFIRKKWGVFFIKIRILGTKIFFIFLKNTKILEKKVIFYKKNPLYNSKFIFFYF